MNPLYMLDTDIVSYVVRGRPPEFRRHLRELPDDQLCISAITLAELMYGLERLPPDHVLHGDTADFLTRVQTLPWPEEAAVPFARSHWHLVSTGRTIGEMDVLIAAHALAIGAVLVTGNVRHHARIPGLEIIDWRS